MNGEVIPERQILATERPEREILARERSGRKLL